MRARAVGRACRAGALLAVVLVAAPRPIGAAQQPGTAVPSAQAASPIPSSPRVVAIRIHGNHTTPDVDVLRLIDVRVGEPFDDGLIERVAERLRSSHRFRSVDVRKRFASIADMDQIVIVVIVEERAGVSIDTPMPGAVRRLAASTMFLPVLSYDEGYGLTYGVRFSIVDLVGRGTRLSVPLTWGGERRAAVELETTFRGGPITRLVVTGGAWRREHPAYRLGDRRVGGTLRAERAVAPWLRLAATGSAAQVRFGESDSRFRAAGGEVVADTRGDPMFPRNAVYATAGWDRLWWGSGSAASRERIDLRGYVGLTGRSVLVLRAQHAGASERLPPFEQPFLGGTSSLRGYRAGYRSDDQLAAFSAELRLPVSSPLNFARAGLAVFADRGATYEAHTSVRDAAFDTGFGAGAFLTARVVSARLDVAHAVHGGTRAHVSFGLTF